MALGRPLGGHPHPWDAADTGGNTTFPFLGLLPQLFESLQAGDDLIPLSRPAAAYEEALQLVKEGKVPCRTLRRAVGKEVGSRGRWGGPCPPSEAGEASSAW